jgi:hypothetical protein
VQPRAERQKEREPCNNSNDFEEEGLARTVERRKPVQGFLAQPLCKTQKQPRKNSYGPQRE